MENASKALIIAGAILISIILVGIGVMVVQSANGVVGGAKESFSSQEIQLFNSEFEGFVGDQKGSSVRTLMGKISSSNATHDEEHQVWVKVQGITATAVEGGKDGEVTPSSVSAAVRPTSTYTVSFEQDKDSALIKGVTISSSSSTK